MQTGRDVAFSLVKKKTLYLLHPQRQLCYLQGSSVSIVLYVIQACASIDRNEAAQIGEGMISTPRATLFYREH